MTIENPYSHPIGNINVNLVDLRDTMFNIQELDENKCIVNFQGKIVAGEVMPRAPLILECSVAEIVGLINQLK